MLANGSALRANGASGLNASGANAFVEEGSATYQLPAPAGHWITGRLCRVARVPCAIDAKGNLENPNCPGTFEACSQVVNASAQVSGVACPPLLPLQPCDWASMPHLLGSTVEDLKPGAMELDYPYACAAGVVGSTDVTEQTGALCAGLCPAGYACAEPATMQPTRCPQGHVCPIGTAM